MSLLLCLRCSYTHTLSQGCAVCAVDSIFELLLSTELCVDTFLFLFFLRAFHVCVEWYLRWKKLREWAAASNRTMQWVYVFLYHTCVLCALHFFFFSSVCISFLILSCCYVFQYNIYIHMILSIGHTVSHSLVLFAYFTSVVPARAK